MTTDALIRELARQIRPVRPLAPPLARFVCWAVAAVAFVLCGVAALGARVDVATVSRAPSFLVKLALPLALSIAAALSAFEGSVPGERSRRSMLVPITILASWVLVITVELRLAGGGHAGTGAHCIRNLVALAAPPGLLLHAMLRRAAPLDRGESALLATLAAAALADAGTRFVCRNDGALHILAWHCGVVLWLAAVGFIVGRRLGVTRRRR